MLVAPNYFAKTWGVSLQLGSAPFSTALIIWSLLFALSAVATCGTPRDHMTRLHVNEGPTFSKTDLLTLVLGMEGKCGRNRQPGHTRPAARHRSGRWPQGPVGMWYLVSPTKHLAKPQVSVPSQNRRALYKTTRLKLRCHRVVMYRGSGGVNPLAPTSLCGG